MHAALEDHIAVAALGLGGIHGGVGVAQQLAGVAVILGGIGDADAGAEEIVAAIQHEGLGQDASDALGHHDGGGAVLQVFGQHHEFVAAQTGQSVRGAQTVVDAPRHLDQHLIAGQMAQAVVDQLEAVAVDEQHGEGGVPAAAAAHGLIQSVQQQGAVGQAGQGVVQGVVDQLFLGGLADGDVLDQTLEIQQLAFHVAHGPAAFGNPDDAAVAAIDLAFEVLDLIVLGQGLEEFVAAAGVHIELAGDVGQAGHQLVGGLIAVDAGQGRIGGQILAVFGGLKDAFDGVLEDAAKAGLGFDQGAVALGAVHVFHRRHQGGDGAGMVGFVQGPEGDA